MAARKMPVYEVVSGCIQEGQQIFDAGSEYIPPNTKIEAQLLEAGVIARARPKAKAPEQDSTDESAQQQNSQAADTDQSAAAASPSPEA